MTDAAASKVKENPAPASKWGSIIRSVLPRRRWLPAISGTVTVALSRFVERIILVESELVGATVMALRSL